MKIEETVIKFEETVIKTRVRESPFYARFPRFEVFVIKIEVSGEGLYQNSKTTLFYKASITSCKSE